MIEIGEFRIARAVEWEGPFVAPPDFFADYEPAVAAANADWLGDIFDPATGDMVMSFHSFVVRTARHTIVVDTCMGNDKERPQRAQAHLRDSGRYLDDLARAGVQPEAVDFVMCTHLHWDHVGWNTRRVDGEWVPTFPNARYVMARREYEYWDAAHARGEDNIHTAGFADSVAPIVRAERAMLVDDDFALEDGVWLEPFPGHTPGNVVINLRSGGARGALPGDVVHSPLQIARPDWSSRACQDPVQSAASRRRFIEQVADTDTVVMPGHFLAPSAGRIVRRGESFAYRSI